MSTVHIIPTGDLVEHHVPGGLDGHTPDEGAWLALECPDDDVDCICLPRPEHVPNPDGPDGWLWVHNALDGRQ